MGEYADESVVDVARSPTMVRMVFFIIQKCFVLCTICHLSANAASVRGRAWSR